MIGRRINGTHLQRIVHTEIRYLNAKEQLKHSAKMAKYRYNTLRWKIKNDLDLWERLEKEKLIQEINSYKK